MNILNCKVKLLMESRSRCDRARVILVMQFAPTSMQKKELPHSTLSTKNITAANTMRSLRERWQMPWPGDCSNEILLVVSKRSAAKFLDYVSRTQIQVGFTGKVSAACLCDMRKSRRAKSNNERN